MALPPTGLPTATTDRDALIRDYRRVRDASRRFAEPLNPEDMVVQSMPDASPTKWHLAHTTWFFETFLLASVKPDHEPVDPAYSYLFNSYYNGIGAQYSRAHRGVISRPTVAATMDYRHRVDRAVESWLTEAGEAELERWAGVVALGLNHEQQHQELMVTDLKHALAQNPLFPAYLPPALRAVEGPGESGLGNGADGGGAASGATGSAGGAGGANRGELGTKWVDFSETIATIGYSGGGFHYDNEGPAHRVLIHPFALADRPVTNGEFLAFMADDGYARPELWLSDGWAAAQAGGWTAPLYWQRREGQWCRFTMAGLAPVDPAAPVCHLSFYEADAFATWAGARLPTEFEWEVAAAGAAGHPLAAGGFAEDGVFDPRPAPTAEVGAGAAGPGFRQLFGTVWEWTRSAYAPYPGYHPPGGAVGEYNGKFMANQFVLRGGSVATPRDHIRATYRNFFYPHCRWQFSGLRLARDGS